MIAEQLGANHQQVLAALRRHGIRVRDRAESNRLRNPLLSDPETLAAAVAETSVAEVADRLGVSVVGVQAALKRNGAQSAHRYNGTRKPRPSPSQLERWWASERTLRGVARRAGVSPPSVAVWLAEVGIFVKSEPALSAKGLRRAIERDDSLAVIAAEHGLSTTRSWSSCTGTVCSQSICGGA